MIDTATVEFAGRLADAAHAIIREALDVPVAANAKGDRSPVTEIDRAVEARLRELIAETFPGDGVIGEEFGAERADAERVWVLDPIDGTAAFMVGLPAYGSLIGLALGGVPALGVIDQPVTGDRWVGVSGAATTLNGRVIHTRACEALADAVVCTTAPEYYRGGDEAAFARLAAASRWTVYGGNCYVFGTLAAGRADVVIEADVGAYDYCALVPVVEGAGGVMTDWSGARLGVESGINVVAVADPRRHAKVIELLSGQ